MNAKLQAHNARMTKLHTAMNNQEGVSTPALPSQDQSSVCTHTPGPWKVMACPVYGGMHPYHDTRYITTGDCDFAGLETEDKWTAEKGSILCQMRDTEFHRADANLIAAAPNLLEACKSALAALRDPNDEDVDRLESILESAISKAQGKA